MANDYSVFIYNIMNQRVIAEAPMISVSYNWDMDAPGSADVTIPLSVTTRAGTLLDEDDVYPVRTAVAISRNGELVWGGMVWTYDVDLGDRTIQLNCSGYMKYYGYRNWAVTGKAVVRGLDIADVMKEFISVSVERDDGIKTNTNGIQRANAVRSYTWNAFEAINGMDLFPDLADTVTGRDREGNPIGGFYFGFEPYWVGGQSDKIGNIAWTTSTRNPFYGYSTPYYSSAYNSSNPLVLLDRSNCEFQGIKVDGTEMSSVAFAYGSNTGNSQTQPWASARNHAAERFRPSMDNVTTYSGDKLSSSLKARALTTLAFTATPIVQPQVVTYSNAVPPMDVRPGMLVHLTNDDGFFSFSNDKYVVTQFGTSVARDGSDRLEMTMVQEDLFLQVEENEDPGSDNG